MNVMFNPYRKPEDSFLKTELPCTVRLARSDKDIAKVMAVRARGFAKFLGPGVDPADSYDFQPNSYLLLAEDHKGEPVGTIRFLHRPAGRIETESYVDLSLDPKLDNCIEGTRFTIPFYEGSRITKLALWKAGYLLARVLQVPSLIAPVRKPARRDYEALLFTDTGLNFPHPRDAQKREHFIMHLDIRTVEQRYRSSQHKLHDFFFVHRHPEIRLIA